MVLNVITREHIHSINIQLTFEHFEHYWIHSNLRFEKLDTSDRLDQVKIRLSQIYLA